MSRSVRDVAMKRARDLLIRCADGFDGDGARIAASIELAEAILAAARADERVLDRARRTLLGRLCNDETGQAFVSALADQVHRTRSTSRSAETIVHLLDALGTPRFLPAPLRAPLAMTKRGVIPSALVGVGIRRGIRIGATGLLHDAAPEATRALVTARAREATTVNVNLVGEVVLGEREADARAAAYDALIRDGTATAISVKLSSIASQISLPSYDATLDMLEPRLRAIYERAQTRAPHVLVNLDMEAFDDLDLTFALHRRLARDEAFCTLTTGVVLQAYLPDAHAKYDALLELAHERSKRGWAPPRVRIVKGANLAMERHQASLRGHPLPVYASKAETDASWLALVSRALRPENARVLEVGVASHNVFDLAFALVLRAENGVHEDVVLEMLEGMADPLRRTLADLAGSMLVYAPIVEHEGFDAAIAYLVRRLEEATTPGHFMRASFGMEVGDARYEAERVRFEMSARARNAVPTKSLRARPHVSMSPTRSAFENVPDTDWAVPEQRDAILTAVRALASAQISDVESIVSGRAHGARITDGRDPSRPGFVPYAIRLGDASTVDAALTVATRSTWKDVPASERAQRLYDVATAMQRARPSLVASMVLDAGKRVVEADAEVSEAIDFAAYYACSLLALEADRRVRASPLGVVLVSSPWNFPLAIGAGGAIGALAAGNAVVLKPSPKTPFVAREFVRLAHAAGIPEHALSLLVVDDEAASLAVLDERTAAVVLTGSTATARAIRKLRPSLALFAETGGKNAMIVTARADRDLAIRDAVTSAFGHAGQKCSATSLLICEREVYEDRGFRERLVDATRSLPVGSAWDARSIVTPLIEPPRGPLARALSTLEEGESWLVAPRYDMENHALVGPSIKLSSPRGGFTHRTELFGPVLSLMGADSLDDAISLANDTPYGLTGAIHSLDPREVERFLGHIEVGNAYVNRGTTGAIVRRQPFGGTKRSCFGPGAKAGGPAYVRQLSRIEDGASEVRVAPLNDAVHARLRSVGPVLGADTYEALLRIAARDAAVFEIELAHARDPSAIPTQRNLFVHVPRREVALVITDADSPFDVVRALIAADACGALPTLLLDGSLKRAFVHHLAEHVALLPRDAHDLVERLRHGGFHALRTLSAPSGRMMQAATATDITLLHVTSRESAHDALRAWLEERSLTIEDHRYGQPLPEVLRARWPLPS